MKTKVLSQKPMPGEMKILLPKKRPRLQTPAGAKVNPNMAADKAVAIEETGGLMTTSEAVMVGVVAIM